MEEPKKENRLSKNNNHRENENDSTAVYKPAFVHNPSLVPMVISDGRLKDIDSSVVSKRFYNKFNFSKLTTRNGNLAVGITSANKQEGKTLVAANMAVSLARAYRQRTVLVDLNFNNPQLHKIFGARLKPGLAEAMRKRMMRVIPTLVDDLYLLPAGDILHYSPGIKDTITLREILYTLKNEFDFIIVDMSSIFPLGDFPLHFVNEVDGLINVIDAKNTKKDELEKIYKHIDERRFIGYVFNRFNDNQ